MSPMQLIAMLQQGMAPVGGISQDPTAQKVGPQPVQVPRVRDTPYGTMPVGPARPPARPWPEAQGTPFGDMGPVATPTPGAKPVAQSLAPTDTWSASQLPNEISSFTMAAPPLAPGPTRVDTSMIEKMLAEPFTPLPELNKHTYTDLKPYAEKRKGMAPKDMRKDAKTRGQENFRDALAAAAAGAQGADSLGDVALGAGAAFGGQMSQARRDREREDREFAEVQRQWDMEMNALDMEIANSANMVANAESDRAFQHALANQQALLGHKDKMTEAGFQLAQIRAQESTAAAQAQFGNNRTRWELSMPKYSEDGATVRTNEFSPDGKRLTSSVKPVGIAGRVQQLEQLGTLAPTAEMLGKEQLGYDQVMGQAPAFGANTLLANIMRGPNADKILDKDDTTGFNFLENPAGIFGYIGDALGESSYEKLEKKVRTNVEKEAKAGLITDPSKIEAIFRAKLAEELMRNPDPELRRRVTEFGTSGDRYGMKLTMPAEQRR